MSQIFDALQRSEAERAGNHAGADTPVTALLQRAERHAAARRDTANPVADERSVERPKSSRAFDAGAGSAPVAVLDSISANNATLPDEPLKSHQEFQSLKVSTSSNPQSRLVCLAGMESPATEAFHLLGVRLRHLRRSRTLKKILITSTIPQEGKSVVAGNLACTLAVREQQRVLLLEGDVRRPTQAKVFNIEAKPGICEWLRGERTIVESIYRMEGPDVWILPAGVASSDSLELLQSGKLAPLMDQLSAWFDWIIIDSPPVLPLADTSVWTNLADGILLVTRQGTTQKQQLERGIEALGSQKLIGAILNSSKSVSNNDYYYRPPNRISPND